MGNSMTLFYQFLIILCLINFLGSNVHYLSLLGEILVRRQILKDGGISQMYSWTILHQHKSELFRLVHSCPPIHRTEYRAHELGA